MTPETTTALISAGAAVLTANVAMLLNHRAFSALDNRINDLSGRMTNLENRLDRRLDSLQTDLKEFFKTQAEHDKRLARIEGTLGIPLR